jgi:tRNA A-37 threonylcarbamoyl transferase component Bud32
MPDKNINGAEKGAVNTATLERKIQQYLDALPKDLQHPWLEKYEVADDKDMEALEHSLREFTERREVALFSMETPDGLDENVVKEIKDFDTNVLLSFRNPSLFQGNGATAEVYEMLGHPGICVKFIINQDRYDENNHIRTEFNFLNAVRNIKYGRVRVPKPYFLRIHPRDGHSYGMERVNGSSLSQILERPEENGDLIALSKRLDRQQVIEEFAGFVTRMHEQGITHNDIYLRNLMLDQDGGLFLIDFGKAKRDESENARVMHQESDLASLNSEIRSFFQSIDKLTQ